MNDETLQTLLSRLEHEWAPELLHLASRIVFYDSLGWLMGGFIFVVIAGILARYAVRWWKIGCKKDDDGKSEDPEMSMSFIAGVVAVPLAFIGALILLNIWNWVGVFDPELAVAHRIFDAIINKR